MTWSEQSWLQISTIFEKIKAHPFITELMAGILPQEKFAFYLHQDANYLREFGRVLAAIGAKLEEPTHTKAFLGFATDTVAVEQALHATFLQQYGQEAKLAISPTCMLYTGFLHQQLNSRPLPVAVASVLPCFWIYKAVGDYILENQTAESNPYQAWIDTYGGEAFGEAVKRALAIGDALAAAASSQQNNKMTEAFVKASQLEWMFWDSAYRLEKWPV